MERIYPMPVARLKTKTRCEYHLYDCRAIGKYFLDEQGYCARHYDAVWKWKNPVLGQRHDWHRRPLRRDLDVGDRGYDICRQCAVVRYVDGIAQSPCRGGQARIFVS